MKKILLALLILLIPSQVMAAEIGPSFFALFDVCRNDTVNLSEYGIQTFGTLDSGESPGGDYSVVFVSADNQRLLEYNFTIEFSTHGTGVNPETGELEYRAVELDCVEKYFRFPYSENMSRFQVLKNGTLIYDKPICNSNSSCDYEIGESKLNCPADCTKTENNTAVIPSCLNLCGDSICQEVVCQSTGCPCPENKATCPQDCTKAEINNTDNPIDNETTLPEPKGADYTWILIIVLVVLMAAGAFFFLRRRSKNSSAPTEPPAQTIPETPQQPTYENPSQ